MSNSKLVNYTKISPHKNVMTNKKITKITIHHMAGNLSVETCGNVFQSREASANYGIDSNGRVGLYVEEKDRSWASCSAENDGCAVTIEVANDVIGGNWHVSDKAYNKLIELCVDICQRNGIKKLNYTGDKNGNLTMHSMFTATACPGPYLKSKFPDIAKQVNAKLTANTSTTSTNKTSTTTTSSTSSTSNKTSSTSNKITKGAKVVLKGVAIYTSATATTKAKAVNGTYYLWDSTITNGRVKITNSLTNVGKTGQVTGWVNVADTGLNSGITSTNTASTTSTTTTTTITKKTMTVTASNGVNVRATASTTGKIVCAIPKNTKVVWEGKKATGSGYTWYYITISNGTYKNKKGYIAKDFLK